MGQSVKPRALVRVSIAAEKSIYLQQRQADLHLEMGDQISTEMEIDDGWQGVRVFLCLRASACVCVYICVFVARGGGLAERLPLCWEKEGV